MRKTFITWRAHYGEVEKLNLFVEWLGDARYFLQSKEDIEIVITCEPNENQIKFHLARLIETDNIDPEGPYELESIKTITLECHRYYLDDQGTWTK
jgi:hypothetical protein